MPLGKHFIRHSESWTVSEHLSTGGVKENHGQVCAYSLTQSDVHMFLD